MHPSATAAGQRAYLWRRREALERALGLICAACGDSTGPFSFDHIDPATKRRASNRESRAGRLGEYWRLYRANLLQLLCEPCNSSKGNKCVDYRPRGHMEEGLRRLRDQQEKWLNEHLECRGKVHGLKLAGGASQFELETVRVMKQFDQVLEPVGDPF